MPVTLLKRFLKLAGSQASGEGSDGEYHAFAQIRLYCWPYHKFPNHVAIITGYEAVLRIVSISCYRPFFFFFQSNILKAKCFLLGKHQPSDCSKDRGQVFFCSRKFCFQVLFTSRYDCVWAFAKGTAAGLCSGTRSRKRIAQECK